MRCAYARNEGGYWVGIDLPENIASLLPDLHCDPSHTCRRMINLGNYGYVAAVRLPTGIIYDPELSKHGTSCWRGEPYEKVPPL